MDRLNQKTLKVARGFTYNYYTSPAKEGKPTLILFHGWADSADLWDDFTSNYLVPNGYGVIAIDCLGYAGTDKPTDWQSDDAKKMAEDHVQILDNESVDKVVSVGHDWGAAPAQRLYNFYPTRVIGIITVSVAYIPPGPFELDAALELSKQVVGYGNYWYWKFFTADDGPAIMNANVEATFHAEHGIPESWMQTFCKEDGMRDFISNDRRNQLETYVTEEYKTKWIQRLKRDKFDGPNCWYKAWMRGEPHPEAQENIVVKVPLLYYGGSEDKVCRPESMQGSIDAGLVPNCKTVTVDAGHYCMYNDPKLFGETLLGWIKENF